MNPIPYQPTKVSVPSRILPLAASAWIGIEDYLEDILEHFHVARGTALEFGVEHGYSTVALSNFFKTVIGVDHFFGDSCTGQHDSWYSEVRRDLRRYPNIRLVNNSWQSFTELTRPQYDLIHIDIEHTYEQTYNCGLWSLTHSPVVLFHDTIAWPEVMTACRDLADKTSSSFYNWDYRAGLGIMVRS